MNSNPAPAGNNYRKNGIHAAMVRSGKTHQLDGVEDSSSTTLPPA